jgi:hypothetical protein
MQNRPRFATAMGLRIVALFAAGALSVSAVEPVRWRLAGNRAADYESGVDEGTKYDGLPTTYLKAKKEEINGFGTLLRDIPASEYQGKRLRLSASVKTKGVRQWAGLWMRVDKGKGNPPLAFDNMYDRQIKGTNEWHQYQVVLDVAPDATALFFGVLLVGTGQVWLTDVRLEPVGLNVPTTRSPFQMENWKRQHPGWVNPDTVNLDFSEG